jgi:hypothetical protein
MLYSHRGVLSPPAIPDLRPGPIGGTPIPVPGRIGKRGFPVSRSRPNRETGVPSPVQVPRPNRESGERELESGNPISESGPAVTGCSESRPVRRATRARRSAKDPEVTAAHRGA